MGAVVAQGFIARHPGMVGGFVNVDGVPFPFGAKRAKFMGAAKIYRLMTRASRLGLLRLPLSLAGATSAVLRQAATPPRFPLPVVLAQMQDPLFWAAIAREMPLMMGLCDAAAAAWGPAFTAEELGALANAAPAACGDVRDAATGPGAWADLPRARGEEGEGWAAPEATRAALDRLLARAAAAKGRQEGEPAPLWRMWQRLTAVRVLSARNYDFGAASRWYDADMRALEAAEHGLLALVPEGGAGRRLVFPTRSHNQMFFGMQGLIVRQVEEVAAAVMAAAAAARHA